MYARRTLVQLLKSPTEAGVVEFLPKRTDRGVAFVTGRGTVVGRACAV